MVIFMNNVCYLQVPQLTEACPPWQHGRKIDGQLPTTFHCLHEVMPELCKGGEFGQERYHKLHFLLLGAQVQAVKGAKALQRRKSRTENDSVLDAEGL